MQSILYFIIQIIKIIVYFITMIFMFMIVLLAVVILGGLGGLISLKKIILTKIFPSSEFKNKKKFYQMMHISRIDYIQAEFVASCIQEQIDPYIAKIFWNAYGTHHFLKNFPYKPKLEDQIALLDDTNLYCASSTTMEMSGSSIAINYDEIKDIQELLKLINHDVRDNYDKNLG